MQWSNDKNTLDTSYRYLILKENGVIDYVYCNYIEGYAFYFFSYIVKHFVRIDSKILYWMPINEECKWFKRKAKVHGADYMVRFGEKDYEMTIYMDHPEADVNVIYNGPGFYEWDGLNMIYRPCLKRVTSYFKIESPKSNE